MKDRLILFVTDRGFIVPTLVAVHQVLAQPSVTQVADVMVALVGFSPSELADLSAACSSSELTFVPLALKISSGAEKNFRPNHVPLTSIARLATPALISAKYEHIIYLDGDVQVVGDLLPLVAYDVPEGRLLAANDRLSFSKFRFGELGVLWRITEQYFGDLGLEDANDYFNAGVLAARRETWAELCGDAMAFFEAHAELCRFHDQSALNVVSRGRREVLSPRYNFATGLAELVDYKKIKPTIVHFTGDKKPWLFDDVSPWGAAFSQPYDDMLATFPFLQTYVGDWSRMRAERAQQMALKTVTLKAAFAKIWYRMENWVRLKKGFARAIQLESKVLKGGRSPS